MHITISLSSEEAFFLNLNLIFNSILVFGVSCKSIFWGVFVGGGWFVSIWLPVPPHILFFFTPAPNIEYESSSSVQALCQKKMFRNYWQKCDSWWYRIIRNCGTQGRTCWWINLTLLINHITYLNLKLNKKLNDLSFYIGTVEKSTSSYQLDMI